MYPAYKTSFSSNADFLRLLACFFYPLYYMWQKGNFCWLFLFVCLFNKCCNVSSSEDGFLFQIQSRRLLAYKLILYFGGICSDQGIDSAVEIKGAHRYGRKPKKSVVLQVQQLMVWQNFLPCIERLWQYNWALCDVKRAVQIGVKLTSRNTSIYC